MIAERTFEYQLFHGEILYVHVDDDILSAEKYGRAMEIAGSGYEQDLDYWTLPGTEPPPEILGLMKEKGIKRIQPKKPSRGRTRLALAAAATI